MGDKRIRSFRLNLDREVIREGRAPATHFLLDAGRFRLEQEKAEGAYTPFAVGSDLDSADWYHEVHCVIVPLEGDGRSAPEARHLCIRNAADPGPHLTMVSARDAFRAIPATDRSFAVDCRSSVTLWIQAGEYGEWHKGKYSVGTMYLSLYREDA